MCVIILTDDTALHAGTCRLISVALSEIIQFATMAAPIVSWQTFVRAGNVMVCRAANRQSLTALRSFKSVFGTTPRVVSRLWRMSDLDSSFQPKHFSCGFIAMTVCANEEVHAAIAGCDRKTFRKHSIPVVMAVSDVLPKVVSVICFEVDVLFWFQNSKSMALLTP